MPDAPAGLGAGRDHRDLGPCRDLEIQGIHLFAMQNGYLDDVDIDRIRECQAAMTEFFTTRKTELLEKIANDKPDLKKDTASVDAVKAALDDLKKSWK